MNHKNPNRYASRIILAVTLFCAALLYGEAMYRHGVTHGMAQKVCASVPGEQVVSSTSDVCHYANSYGRAIKTRRAG